MRFSVVIPTFNRAAYLRRTLDRVWTQTFSDFEVIVVDDGSTDGTGEYLAWLGARARVVSLDSSSGPGVARNAGVAAASGEYIAFLDSDDLWFPWTLEIYSKAIDETDGPALMVGHVVEFDDQEPDVARQPLRFNAYPDYLSSARHAVVTGSGTMVVGRRAFVDCGGFAADRVNSEDNDLALRLGEARGFVAISAPATVAWRRHPNSLTASADLSLAGADFLIAGESSGRYPGGQARARSREQIIARHVRPISLAALESGRPAAAARLYRASFRWHLRQGRWSYLAWFPVRWLLTSLGGRRP